jgi:hypothetical protein
MGSNVLPERPDGVVIPTAWFNEIRQTMLADLVPRNSAGIPENLAGSLGTQLLQWDKVYASSIFLDGTPLETTFLKGRSWRIEDGTKKASGFPQYLVAAGTGNGLNCTIDTSEEFRALANGEQISLLTNVVFSSLTPAPSSNHTALVNDTDLAGGVETETLGELDNKPITIDTIGSEISDRDGEYGAFKTPAGEVFLAIIDTTNNQLLPVVRGFGGTARAALSNNDTLTYMQINTLLFNNDGNTKISSPSYPINVAAFPAAGNSGNVYVERTGGAQGYDDGADILEDYVIVGYAICDDTDCLHAEQIDFDLSWNNTLDFPFRLLDNANIEIMRGANAGVKSVSPEFFSRASFNTTTNLEAGEVLTANTELFIYLDDTGTVTFSHKKPRRYGYLQRGLYHPTEYWRVVGSVMLDGSAVIAFRKKINENKESITDSLVPIGVPLPMLGAYFGNGSNGSPTRVIASNITELKARLPSNWSVLDGSENFDPESDIYRQVGRFLPNLTDDRFLQGNNSIGGIGGNATVTLAIANLPSHTHSISHGHNLNNAASDGHTHTPGTYAAAMRIDGSETFARIQSTGVVTATARYAFGGAFSGSSEALNSGIEVSGLSAVGTGGSAAAVVSHSGNSGGTGSGSSFNIVPKFMGAIYIMRTK